MEVTQQMRRLLKGAAGLVLSALLLAPVSAIAQDAVDSGMTVYMQMEDGVVKRISGPGEKHLQYV